MTAIVTFTIYLGIVFLIAILANRAGQSKSFVNEYFLGSRNIGLWAFAFTYAATSASGGTFMGFPSLIYTHGWVLAWWIAGYMIVPLVALGLLAKRINQVSRLAGAITVPEVLRRRFESHSVGNLATILLLFFMFFFLMAQFKAGAEIMATLLEDAAVYQGIVLKLESLTAGIPWVGAAEGDYLLCLILFATAVIIYTTYGGFRAVVWTDVMQGIVMLVGVILMLVFAIRQVDGLGNATRQLAAMTPPEFVTVSLEVPASPEVQRFARGRWIEATGSGDIIRLKSSVTIPAGETLSLPVEALKLTTPAEIEKVRARVDRSIPVRAVPVGATKTYAYGAGEKGVYTSAPGPSADNPQGFLSVLLALSFFAFWNFSGAGQPSYMVRQMAYRDTITLRRSMVMIAFYFTIIYFPLIVIFTCARVLMPGMEIHPDRIMPEMAAELTFNAGVPWLAGFLVAAPFAAVMSSVDSFLTLVSSGVVRDVYQTSINPAASENQVKRLSYLVTLVVGILGVLAVLHPPQFLQHLIVFASAGLGASFLAPMVFALYWSRMTSAAAVGGMLSGGLTILALYFVGFLRTGKFGEYLLLGLHPFICAVIASSFIIIAMTLTGKKPPLALRERFFGAGG